MPRKRPNINNTNHKQSRKFSRRVKFIFSLAGFSFLDSEGYDFKIGHRAGELDAIFYYQNIILICEYTSRKNNIKDHIRSKHEFFQQIDSNKKIFLEWLANTFNGNCSPLTKYTENQVLFRFLYFSEEELKLDESLSSQFPLITFVEPRYLEYFYKTAQCIHKSIKYEIYRFLQITDNQIGLSSTESGSKSISTTIISPEEFTGTKNGVRTVSFMMSAETLIKNSYVLRKDNWEDSIILYQRLIQKDKLRGIRKFLSRKEETFYNNIIVALPDDVFFLDKDGQQTALDKIKQCGVYTMMIPDKMNTICIIDGQHRIYAHYEGSDKDPMEPVISGLRKKLHLLVTGLVFPPKMSNIMRSKIESEIFLEINTNAKPIPPDVLLHIKGIKDPLSDIGLARAIIEKLNNEQIFYKKFELSLLEYQKIKIASIIKFALRYLVSIDEKEKKNLYYYWSGDKSALQDFNDDAYNDYLTYCTHSLKEYFSAIRACFKNDWENSNSKLLSVISINGFILAYASFIDNSGIKDFHFFRKKFKHLKVDFSKQYFPYTSSQYKKFSIEILRVLNG